MTSSGQRLLVLQSLWAMERRHTDGFERSIEENVAMIAEAGFDGVSTHWTDHDAVARVSALLRERGMTAEGQCFPKTVDDLKPVLDIASKYPLHHLDIQPDIRPRRVADCLPLLEGWMRLAEEVDFPVLIETHRDRMTTDLFFMLDLLDAMPELPLVADLSHYLVGREFARPVDDENHAMIGRILQNAWAFHGRVASREQVQIEISFPPHRMWVELFERWWSEGFSNWRGRAAPDATLAFTCELGPKPYAIIGRDGNDTTDRWAESLQLRDIARKLWEQGLTEAGD
ncbi:sugar phosphate isomerase/epimerase family protein [Jiella pelagia]|uniref:Sugar phosphate isomerase/epimerase n=1 Tax=Jiella pelagia TaxID=2986949 RepID=A0ABY7BT62_9HYPH|nr:sugar phosphate isomerase/epimerase [Jiella pelagia]WAP66787.1 sugar phosphate isomerase/epimerase [Jiella pelagia]